MPADTKILTRHGSVGNRLAVFVMALAVLVPGGAGAQRLQTRQAAEPPASTARPVLADLERLLEVEKPDPARIAALTAAADAAPPAGVGSVALARFHMQRANRRSLIGRLDEAIEDSERAVRLARGTPEVQYPAQLGLGWLLVQKQDMRRAVATFSALEREADVPGSKGWTFAARRGQIVAFYALGEKRRAEQAMGRQRAMLQESRSWPIPPEFRSRWAAQVEASAVAAHMAEQEFDKAEASAQRAEQMFRRMAARRDASAEEKENTLFTADGLLMAQARAKLNQGRLAEAETDARNAVLSRIASGGKYQVAVGDYLSGLQYIKFLQGRYEDALRISDQVLAIYDEIKLPHTLGRWVRTMNARAWLLGRMARREEVEQAYRLVDEATEGWPEDRKLQARTPPHRMAFMVNTNRSAEAITTAQQALARSQQTFGDDHIATAMARGNYASMLSRTGQAEASLPEFRKAIASLLDNAVEEKDDIDSGGTAGIDQQLRYVVLNYLFAMSIFEGRTPADIDETFRYGESVRADSVQRALLAASTRAALQNPQLVTLVRREQDAEKQLTVAVDALRAALGASVEERNAQNIAALRGEVVRLRDTRRQVRQEISRRVPAYEEMVRPQPPSIAQVQAALQPGEVYLSIYVGDIMSFVWAIPKEGEAQFARVAIGRVRVGELVNRVRGGLNLASGSLLDVPDFDVDAAAQIYEEILKPVEATINKGNKLLIAANGTLGGLPFGLLAREAPKIDASVDPMFVDYRKVSWLIRTHSVTMLPSAATLRSLRMTNNARPGRQPFIGFGDPIFSREGETAQPTTDTVDPDPLATRGARRNVRLAMRNLPRPSGVDQASFSQLQRLPDTADELVSIARALGSDPARSVILQEKANERTIRTTDLSGFRVVAFATHGLVPGELPGLRSPALALTAPEIARIDGDGLLTMEEVLQLKLDADWVILSACNTGSGINGDAAAEAASGLGRAFFYAGSRALLVTGWAVHSASARELVTDLFQRQAQNPGLTRSQALQQAMLQLIDEGAIKDTQGNVLATYAHPVFWAPYILIGEGGAAR